MSEVLARDGTLLGANCARRRISSAAATSAWHSQPHETQQNRLLRRLSAETCKQRPHVCDEYLGSTSTIRRAAHAAFSAITLRSRPNPASSITRFNADFARTLQIGRASCRERV